MLPKNIFILLLILIISYNKCEDEQNLDDNDDNNEQIFDFKKSLKKYLTDANLINSERVIEREEFEKIFIDVLTEKDREFIPEFLKLILEKLSKYFLDKYYKKKKIIKGKDIYDLIKIEEISTKFQQITGNPDYDFSELDDEEEYEYEEEENDSTKKSSDL